MKFSELSPAEQRMILFARYRPDLFDQLADSMLAAIHDEAIFEDEALRLFRLLFEELPIFVTQARPGPEEFRNNSNTVARTRRGKWSRS